MLRRKFLKQVAAAAASTVAASASGFEKRPLRVGIVGGGIVGASVAYHLAQAGAQVILFEKAQPASGATQNSFAWLNAFVTEPAYRALRLQSLVAYHDLDRRLTLGIIWGGYTSWAHTPAEVQSLRDSAAQMAGTSDPVKMIDAAALTAMTPSLIPGPVTEAFYSNIDGHLDPVGVTNRLLERAQARGATVMLQCEVTDLDLRGSRLTGVQTRRGRVAVDRLVVAAGVDTPGIVAKAGFKLNLRHAPGILAHSKPTSIVTPIIFDAPGTLSFKQMADGSIVGTDSPLPPDIPAHRGIRAHPMPFPEDSLRAMHGNRILNKIAAVLPAARGVALQRLTLGFRPMPTDDLPVVGLLPGTKDIHVVVTHSGVTLAPILGRYVTAEVLHDARIKALSPFRPERFSREDSV
jgi:glycine/D-amino acid oxidase-like deaminating enzyme